MTQNKIIAGLFLTIATVPNIYRKMPASQWGMLYLEILMHACWYMMPRELTLCSLIFVDQYISDCQLTLGIIVSLYSFDDK